MITKEVTDMQESMTRIVFKFEGRSSNGDAHSIASVMQDVDWIIKTAALCAAKKRRA